MIDSVFRPEPLAWLYQPPNGGLDSRSRSYRGFNRHSRVRTLRPARPVRVELDTGDLLTLTNSDGATPVLLIPLNASGEFSPTSIGLQSNSVLGVEQLAQMAVLPAAGVGLSRLFDRYRADGGVHKEHQLAAIRVFDDKTAPGETFIVRSTQSVSLWLLVDPAFSMSLNALYAGGSGGSKASLSSDSANGSQDGSSGAGPLSSGGANLPSGRSRSTTNGYVEIPREGSTFSQLPWVAYCSLI